MQKSLRALAIETGFSVNYLSQVKLGQRPASRKLLEALNNVGVLDKLNCNDSQDSKNVKQLVEIVKQQLVYNTKNEASIM
jgi:transcriptional regulator with XRE-family HTH domain